MGAAAISLAILQGVTAIGPTLQSLSELWNLMKRFNDPTVPDPTDEEVKAALANLEQANADLTATANAKL